MGHTALTNAHYNTERPNQARSCGNRPPRVAFPELPPSPPLPMLVDPDAWLPLIDGRRYVRQVQANGTVRVEHTRYYVGRHLAGQRVALAVAAAERALVVYHGDILLKQLPPVRLAWGDPRPRPLRRPHATRSSRPSATSPSSLGRLNQPGVLIQVTMWLNRREC